MKRRDIISFAKLQALKNKTATHDGNTDVTSDRIQSLKKTVCEQTKMVSTFCNNDLLESNDNNNTNIITSVVGGGSSSLNSDMTDTLVLQMVMKHILDAKLVEAVELMKLLVRRASYSYSTDNTFSDTDFNALPHILSASDMSTFKTVFKHLQLAAGDNFDAFWSSDGYITTMNNNDAVETSSSSSSSSVPTMNLTTQQNQPTLVGAGGTTSSQQQGSSEANDATVSQNVPVSAEDLIVWGSSGLIGATVEKVEITQRFIYPLLFSRALTPEKALLLYGPPGSGKTQIAKALTQLYRDGFNDAKNKDSINLFVATGADLKGKYVGESEKLIRNKYKALQEYAQNKNNKNARSLLFIDEVEVIAGDRLAAGDTTIMSTTVTALLQTLEGVVSFPNVVTVAATNIPWALDSAINRRFTTKILIDVAGNADRVGIVRSLFTKRLQSHSIGYDEIKKKEKSSWSDDENQQIAKEDDESAKDVNEFDKNKAFFKLSIWLSESLGWQSNSETVIIDYFKTQKLDGAEDNIKAFIKNGDHQPGALSDLEKIKDIRKQYAPNIENITKDTFIQSDDDKIKDLRKPLHVFGFTNSDITNIINKSMNDYAIHCLENKEVTYNEKNCVFITNDITKQCDSSHRANFRIPFEWFLDSEKKNIDEKFIEILQNNLIEVPTSIKDNEYMAMVYFKITQKEPDVSKS